MIRAKFKCQQVATFETGETITLNAVYGKDGTVNAQWSKFTPNGTLSLSITNPDAQGKFTPGKEYFLDIAEAPPEG